jgi:hypothetical protein
MTSFIKYLAESNDLSDNKHEYADHVIGELKKLIKKGAADLEQDWKNALELTNTAFKVANVQLPTLVNARQWKQYVALIRFAVAQLRHTRGGNGNWRMTPPVIAD